MRLVCKKCNTVLRDDNFNVRYDDVIYVLPCKCTIDEINEDAKKLAEKILGRKINEF